MGSLEQRQGTGPPSPADVTALGLEISPCSDREEDVPRAPCSVACVATATSGLRCKALLVLTICLSFTVLPYAMDSLSQTPPASLRVPPAQPGSKAYQSRVSDNLVTVSQDGSPVTQQPETALVGSAGTFQGVEGDSHYRVDAVRWKMGTSAGDTAGPSAPQTLLTLQPGTLTAESQGSGVATIAVMLSKALEHGIEMPAKLSPELHTSPGAASTAGWSHPGSHPKHGAALGSSLGKGPGLHRATQPPAVASACRHELCPLLEPMRTMPRSSPLSSSKVVSSISPMSQLPFKMQSQGRKFWATLWALSRPHQKPAMVESSTAALGRQPRVPTPSRASPGTEEQPVVDAGPELLGMVSAQVAAHEGAAGKAPVPSSVPLGAGLAEIPAGAPTLSHATTDWSLQGPRQAGTASLGQQDSSHPTSLPDLTIGKDHTAASRLPPLPGDLPPLPSARPSSLAKGHPGTLWATSSQKARGTQSAESFLHGEATLLVNTFLVKAVSNGSSLLAAASISPPRDTAASHALKHQHMLTASPATEELMGAAVTSEKQGNLSSHSTKLPTPISTEDLPSSTLTRGSRAPSDPMAAVSLAPLDTVSKPSVVKTSCKDGAAPVAPPSLKAVEVTDASSLSSPTEMPSLHPKLFPTVSLATAETLEQGQVTRVATGVAGRTVLHGEMAKAKGATSGKPMKTSVDATAAPSGPPEPTNAIQSSAPLPSLKYPTPAHQPETEPAVQTSITVFSPLSYESSTRPMHGPTSLLASWTMTASTGFTPGTWSMPTPLVAASQHPSTPGADLSIPSQLEQTTTHPSLAGEGFTITASPAEPMTTSKLSSSEVKSMVPQAPGLSSPAQPLLVQVLPLQFRLTGIAYTKALSSKSSESYKQLEKEVMLMLNKALSTYENFLQANILEFMNGSVIVRGEALFQGDSPVPTHSHLIRTIITEVSRERNTFSWQLEPRSIQSSGFSLENLDPEKLSISLTVLRLGSVASGGMSRTDPLDGLIHEVIQSLSDLYDVKNFTIGQLRSLRGDLEISGELYLDTDVHADIDEVLQALKALATLSVDMVSLSVEGAKLHLKTYPISFLIINRHFSEDLLDPFSVEYQELARELGDVVERALKDYKSFLQAIIRGFLPGSLICHGDVIFQHPAPTSKEVLEKLAVFIGPDKALAGSGFQVDPYSLAVGEDVLEPPPSDLSFPEYGVVIIVMCGLGIITIPIILLVCLRKQRFGWQDMVALWDRRDPEAGTQTMEMENQGFWEASEEGPEGVQDVQEQWRKSSI